MLSNPREKYQQEAFKAAKDSNFNCAILATVSFGKGRLACLIIEELYNKGCRSFLYTCDNQRLRDTDFPAEIEKWLPINIKNKISIQYECYQTTYKWINKEYDCLIADEFDASLTTQYCKIYFENKFKHKILLSGTLSTDKKKLAEEIAPIVYIFSTIDAEDAGVINKTKYYVYHYKLGEAESRQYLKWTKAIAKALNEEKSQDTINYFANQRKQLLSTLDSSYINCRKIMNWLWFNNKKTRLVVFCERRSQADRVCKWSYHGENEQNDNLNKFQSGEISGISVVSKIKRGVNLKNANSAIMEAFSSSSTEFEQRNGRMKRLESSDLATVIFMLPWYKTFSGDWKPTVVDQYITKATKNLDLKLIDLKL